MNARRIVILAVTATAGIGVTALFAESAGDQWTRADWYSSVVGLAVFLIGIYLGFGQNQLQRALADLELREKITCFDGNGATIEGAPEPVARTLNLVGDARSALPVFDLAHDELKLEFLDALATNLKLVRELVDCPATRRLAARAAVLSDEIENAQTPDSCREKQAVVIRELRRIATA